MITARPVQRIGQKEMRKDISLKVSLPMRFPRLRFDVLLDVVRVINDLYCIVLLPDACRLLLLHKKNTGEDNLSHSTVSYVSQ